MLDKSNVAALIAVPYRLLDLGIVALAARDTRHNSRGNSPNSPRGQHPPASVAIATPHHPHTRQPGNLQSNPTSNRHSSSHSPRGPVDDPYSHLHTHYAATSDPGRLCDQFPGRQPETLHLPKPGL